MPTHAVRLHELATEEMMDVIDCWFEGTSYDAAPCLLLQLTPVSAMSNAQIRAAALRFARDLHIHNLRLFDALDGVSSARRGVDFSQNFGAKQIQEANRQLTEKTKILNDIRDQMVQQDVPLANLYRSELLLRLKLLKIQLMNFLPSRRMISLLINLWWVPGASWKTGRWLSLVSRDR
jgi:hypothetical protein